MALLLLAAFTLSACGTDGFGGGSATTSTTRATTTTSTTSVPVAPAVEVALGERQRTAAGNTVRVSRVRTTEGSTEVAVQACAGPDVRVGVRVRSSQFALFLSDGRVLRGGLARVGPRLDETTLLVRQRCVDGWVGFDGVGLGTPVAVLFLARPDADQVLRWRVSS